MQAKYHIEITRAAVGRRFPDHDLQRIVRANLSQDRLPNLLWRPELHFDGDALELAQAYIGEERAAAARLAILGDRAGALDAFGRLSHTRQDFYAHSNWVALWVEEQGGPDHADPAQVLICTDPLATPGLYAGKASVLHFLAGRVPVYGRWHRRRLTPPDDHEAMNLDHPGRGPLFSFAVAAAVKHTAVELDALLALIESAGGARVRTAFLGNGAPP